MHYMTITILVSRTGYVYLPRAALSGLFIISFFGDESVDYASATFTLFTVTLFFGQIMCTVLLYFINRNRDIEFFFKS